MPQRGSSPRSTQRAIDWKAFDRLAIFLIVTLFFIPFELFLDEVHAHTPVPQTAPAHFSPSSGARQPQQNETPEIPAKPSGDQGIPLPKIADRAEELDRLLREISNQLTPKSELIEAERKTAEHGEEIRRRALQTKELLVGTSAPLELEDERRYWRSRNLEYAEERRLLTLRAAKLVEQIQILEAQQPEWLATWIRIRESPGIESVVERTKQELDKIHEAKSLAQEQLNIVLKLQNKVAQQDQQISDILLQVREARNGEPSHLLEANSLPLWNARQLRQLDQKPGPVFHASFDRSFTTATEFLRARKLAMLSIVGAYLLALLAVFKLSRYAARRTPLEVTSEASHMLGRPFSVALLLTLVGTVKFVASIPIGLAFVFYLVFAIPVLRILAPLVEPRARIFLYVQATLYGLEGLYLLVQLPPLLRRELYAVLVLIALISLVWLVRPSKMPQATVPPPGQQMLVKGIRGALLLLAGSLLANIIGFVSLSQVLGLTALVGPFVGSALYCGARVLALILGVVLRTHWARAVLNLRVDAIERWGSRLFILGASLFWLKLMLQLVTFYDSVIEVSTKLLRHPIGFEKVHFTLGDALGVPLILLGGYFLVSAFTFLLKNVVLPKLPLQRGVPYAISTITYYVLLLFVVLAALSGAGIELNKFTVLTGALGVGLGFGLQNIVNNFVSGLILLVERPIHVGDTVDVGGLVGIVRRIGARSSTVVTFQGAEVIVPNSNLLSNQVINWTLSSQWRRVDVPVRVAYGTDPERVIKLLVAVAESYPGVLLDRPPMAFFMGFGESALNFELRFWSAWQDTWFQLQSDVTVAVAKALREAGMEIPFPQRDLHLRSFDASMAENVLEKGIRATPTDDSPERNAVS